MSANHRRSLGGQGGQGHSKFLAYLIILWFEKQCLKQNTVARLKSKYLDPQKFWTVYATAANILVQVPHKQDSWKSF